MKVCHIITRMILGGAQENTLLTCEGLFARGHEVTLITGPALGPEGELIERARAGRYCVIELDEMRREIRPWRDRRCERRLAEILRELAPDVVHTHSSKAGILGRRAAWMVRGAPGAMPGAMLLPVCGEGHVDVGHALPHPASPGLRRTRTTRKGMAPGRMKIVHTIHGLAFDEYQPWWRRGLYAALERRAARRTDAIISVADAMTAQALRAGVGRVEQYTTIYSGMEVETFLRRPAEADDFRRSLGLPPGAVLVTQVSRLAPMKGHEFLLAAARPAGCHGCAVQQPCGTRLPQSTAANGAAVAPVEAALRDRIHYCLVGDGTLRGWIEEELRRRGLTGRFHLTGLLRPERMPAVFHASDIVVHCSLREGLARTIPQAMLTGKAVIAFDIGGAREVVDSATGVLLPAGDVAGLRAAIDKLAASPDLRSALGAAGRERCRTMFDHNRMVERIEALYERLMG